MPTKKTEETTVQFKGNYFYGTGKRKTSIARVRLYEKGKGQIIINGKPLDEYTNVSVLKDSITYPLELTGNLNSFDISIKVTGGGVTSQTEAIRHGIARGLVQFDDSLRTSLKKDGLLTRDARIKERKKYGLKKARRAPQFSKR